MITFDLGFTKGIRNAQEFMQRHNQITQQEQQINKENDWQNTVMPSYHDALAEQARHKHQQATLGMQLEALQHQGNMSRANIANQLAANEVTRLPQTIAHNNRTVDARMRQERGVLNVMGAGEAIANFENMFANGQLTKDNFLSAFQTAYGKGFTPVTDENGALLVQSPDGSTRPYGEFAAAFKQQQQATGTGHAQNLSGMSTPGAITLDGADPTKNRVNLTYTGTPTTNTGTRTITYNGRQAQFNPATGKLTIKNANGNDETVSLTQQDLNRINRETALNAIGSTTDVHTIVDPATGITRVERKANTSATVQGVTGGAPVTGVQQVSTPIAIDGRNLGLPVVTTSTAPVEQHVQQGVPVEKPAEPQTNKATAVTPQQTTKPQASTQQATQTPKQSQNQQAKTQQPAKPVNQPAQVSTAVNIDAKTVELKDTAPGTAIDKNLREEISAAQANINATQGKIDELDTRIAKIETGIQTAIALGEQIKKISNEAKQKGVSEDSVAGRAYKKQIQDINRQKLEVEALVLRLSGNAPGVAYSLTGEGNRSSRGLVVQLDLVPQQLAKQREALVKQQTDLADQIAAVTKSAPVKKEDK